MADGAGFKPLGRLLIERSLISPQQWQECLEQHRLSGKSLGKVLVESGMVSQEALLQIVANQTKMQTLDLEKTELDKNAIDKVPASVAQVYNIVPVKLQGDTLTVAISDPFNLQFLDDLRFTLSCNIQPVLAAEGQIQEKVNRHYRMEKESIPKVVSELAKGKAPLSLKGRGKEGKFRVEELQELAAQAPVVKLINLIILEAIKDKASDIHFEPFGGEFKIRYRIDGQCREAAAPPKDLNMALASRIKVMANLDVAETRLPQDGRILTNISGRKVDLRVSTLPTLFGESIVMRVLDKSVVSLSLDQAGLTQKDKAKLRTLIHKPNGIVLVTGPTGSGKTTSLHSALSHINKPNRKIWTAEDPVEITQDGLRQVQVNPKIKYSFQEALRSFLRADPDVIMIGEMRDAETAKTAIEASLTGHLVFSTLHTNSAPETVVRLVEMGMDPFNFADALLGILAQRLARMLCNYCKKLRLADKDTHEKLVQIYGREHFFKDGLEKYSDEFYLMNRVGCPKCAQSGYRGRLALHELLDGTEAIKVAIKQNTPLERLRDIAIEDGMRTLKMDGIQKILNGLIDLDQVNKVVL
ncbi:MAG: Flp pilus assembly complex ATPase component TadA [Desulfobacteraceae bacterium]|nr:Flp pilus assembly complex ATPase component TadA [Desulfobacteraceae bacterium]